MTGNINLNISGSSSNILYASDNRELVKFGDNGIIIGNGNINLRLQTAPNGVLTHKVGNNNYEILDSNNIVNNNTIIGIDRKINDALATISG
jgi:hypothetical protein